MTQSPFSFKFKITVSPIKKIDRDWKVNKVTAGRKEKICEVCSKKISIGMPATTFMKKYQSGPTKTFQSKYSCVGCTEKMAEKLYNERFQNDTNP